MLNRRLASGARDIVNDAARISFATAAVALLVASLGAGVNYFAATRFPAGGLATIGLCYVALGIWNLSWRRPRPKLVPVEWARPRATHAYRVTTHSARPWEQN